MHQLRDTGFLVRRGLGSGAELLLSEDCSDRVRPVRVRGTFADVSTDLGAGLLLFFLWDVGFAGDESCDCVAWACFASRASLRRRLLR